MFPNEDFKLHWWLFFTDPPACKFKDFDLNDTYGGMEGFEDGYEGSPTPAFKTTDSPNCPSWMHQDSTQSPPQTSGNSDSTSAQSLSSSNGDAQVCKFVPCNLM